MKSHGDVMLPQLKIIILGLCLILFSTTAFAEKNKTGFHDDAPLFIVRKNCRYGWMNAQGKIIIPPAWDEASEFNDGMALVMVSFVPPPKNYSDYGTPPAGGGFGTLECPGRYGYINTEGKVVIKPQFCGAVSFQSGLASAATHPQSWGIINTSGKFVSKERFAMPYAFSEGLLRYPEVAPLKGEELYGYLNVRGEFAIKPSFVTALPFSEGMAVFGAHTKQGFKYGYLDKNGKKAIPPAFDRAEKFSEGLAFVCSNQQCGYIDKSGMLSIPLAFDDAGEENSFFSGGRAAVKKGEKWGFIDTTGKFVAPPHFYRAYPFSEGLARVLVLGEQESTFGFIDETGTMVIPSQFHAAGDFSEGTAAAFIEKSGKSEEKTGYIDKTGKFVIELENVYGEKSVFRIEGLRPFSEGLASVALAYNKWGYIDMSGNFVIQPQFDRALEFSEGRALVRNDMNKWGYIDKTGAWIVSPQFEGATSFENGAAFVKMRDSTNEMLNVDEYAFIDASGKIVSAVRGATVEMETAFHVKNFSKGLLPVRPMELVKGFGFLDKTLKFVIAPAYEDAGNFSGGLAAAKKNGKWGFIDKSGKWAIQPQFPYAHWFSDGLAMVCKNEDANCGFVDRRGQMVISSGHLEKMLDVKTVYYDSGGFSEGLIEFYAEGKGAGFVDKTGNVVISPDIKFKGGTVMGAGFHEGLAGMGVVTGVDENGGEIVKYGYMDRQGAFVIPPQFYTAGAFKNGLAWVGLPECWHRDGCAWINKKGEVVWEP